MDISLIEQREIEARLASALIEGYAETLGRKEALAIAGRSISQMARQAGQALGRQSGANTLIELAEAARTIWARNNALDIDFFTITPVELRFNVTRCRYAELYAQMDVGDLGYYLSCGRDAAFAEGFNPDIRMVRTQTIMQGAAFCDFRFNLTL
jgi:hypothetical protein